MGGSLNGAAQCRCPHNDGGIIGLRGSSKARNKTSTRLRASRTEFAWKGIWAAVWMVRRSVDVHTLTGLALAYGGVVRLEVRLALV
jgi:hypothetical protein